MTLADLQRYSSHTPSALASPVDPSPFLQLALADIPQSDISSILGCLGGSSLLCLNNCKQMSIDLFTGILSDPTGDYLASAALSEKPFSLGFFMPSKPVGQ